jgi:hypothetical protein
MDLINEYALLVAVATPVAMVAVMNVVLALTGERDALLLPVLRAYPALEIDAVAEAAPAPAPAALEPANDEAVLEAA